MTRLFKDFQYRGSGTDYYSFYEMALKEDQLRSNKIKESLLA
jgi:hypothetical protein